jgi:hypothetical protein
MYDISRPIGQRRFQFHGILSWTIHDAPRLTHFCGILLLYFCDLILYIYIYILKKSCIILNCNSNLTLHLFIYLVGLQTKGKFACPVCGPMIKARHSRSLEKEVFDEYIKFLPKNHSYRTIDKAKFNGKEENVKKPRRITPHLWKFEYIRNCQGMQIIYI